MPVYIGLDCGTQSLSAIVLRVDGPERDILFEVSLAFDEALPAYGTVNGVFTDDDALTVTSSPLLWADALDRVMGETAARLGREVDRLAAVSGSAQQHGSVYLLSRAGEVLGGLQPERPLVDQLPGIYAVDRSPVWMDASTSGQCATITRALGGASSVARLTGSRAFERFTGPQVRKLIETRPDAYARTDRIHLVSSYLATLLAGGHAPIDTADGSGMNLMDLRRGQWSAAAMQATAPGLADRLPSVVPSATVVGRLSSYWTSRHGLPPAKLVAWSGDNPSSLVGLGVVEVGVTAVSLGTSDTVFTLMDEPAVDPAGGAHVFGSTTGGYMSLVCFRNGSLAREKVRDQFGLDWEDFSRALRQTPPGNGGAMMLPWFEPEATPPTGTGGARSFGLEAGNVSANVRAVVEGQMLAMERHSRWAAPEVIRIHAAGGAARNVEVVQVMADVFDAPVHTIDAANAACLGAALRALHGDLASEGKQIDWREVVEGVAEPNPDLAVRPRPWANRAYEPLKVAHAAFEARELVARGTASG
jgi:xylulokinase